MLEAPDAVVTLSTGENVRLSTLWADRPLVLSFLRHSGCLFCREHVGDMKQNADLNVLFVTMDDPEDAQLFREEMESPHLFASDPNRVVYERYEVARGTMKQLFSLRMARRAIQATRKGYRQKRPTADVRQLPGVFVISTEGEIMWHHEARNAADNPSVDEVRNAALLAGSQARGEKHE